MTGSVGYDAARIDELDRQVRWAIGALRGIRSPDPAAMIGLDAIAELRRVLEAHWMPAIDAIRQHDPLARHGSSCRLGDVRVANDLAEPAVTDPALDTAPLDDDEIIARLRDLERLWPHDGDDYRTEPGITERDIAAVVQQLSRRSRDDQGFADRLLDEVGHLDVLAFLVTSGRLEPSLAVDLATVRLSTVLPAGTGRDGAARAAALTARLLDLVAQSPDASADLLDDEWVRARLATDPSIDTDVVARLTAIAIAGGDRPLTTLLDFRELADAGYRFPPGLSRGLAIGFAAVAADVAVGIDRGNALADVAGGPVLHRGSPVTYDDLVGLFASIVDDEAAQVTLAGIVHELGAGAVEHAVPVALTVAANSVGVAQAIGVAFAPTVDLTRLLFVDATTLQQHRLDELFAQHRTRHANSVGVIEAVTGFVPGTDVARWFLSPIFSALAEHGGESDRESVADIGASVELDGVIADLTLRQLATDDIAWSVMFGDLSIDGARSLRDFATSERPEPFSADDLLGQLRAMLTPADHALVATLLATVVAASGADD